MNRGRREPEGVEMSGGYSSVPIKDELQDFWDHHDPGKTRKISLSVLKNRILSSKAADNIPNALVIQLLEKADRNHDGYLDYDEFTQFASVTAEYSKARAGITRAALAVVPRGERTVHKRRYLEEYSCCPPPIFMITCTLVEISAFVYYVVDMRQPIGASGPAPIYSPLIFNPFRRYEAWRYLTYALIHSGYVHLVNNLIVQLILGVILELVHGWWRVGLIYMAGVLTGSLAHSVTAPLSYLAGASGGVYAVIYAHVGNLLMNWTEMEYRWLQLVVLLLLSGSDLAFAFWDSYGSPTPSNTGHMAHLGGAIAGVLVGVYILRNLEEKRWERYCWWVALVVFLILVGIGIILNIALPVPEFFPDNDFTPLKEARDIFHRRF